jgi:pimeloyl-ACP methyl ester carboxylesterase
MARLALLMIAGQLWACGDHNDTTLMPDASEPDALTPDADTGDVPRIEDVGCRFVVNPSLGLYEHVDYACGDLIVEENRETHAGRIRLHFIRFRSEAAITTNRATIYLDGGPGGSGQGILEYVARLGSPFLAGLLVDGEFLVLGQRGTALSVPYLDCREPDCADFPGVDLTAYNTAYNADDVDDLRAAIGFDQLNVYGISYGSRLGLEVLRRHGDRVRAAVIEGLVPPQAHWVAAVPSSVYTALTGLNAACAAAGSCGTTFGNLVTKFLAGVEALEANPVTLQVGGQDVPFDGYTYAYVVFRMMYSRSSYAYLPLAINDLAVRRTDRVGSYLAAWLEALSEDRETASGLYYGVVCNELYNPTDDAAFATENQGVPQGFIDLFGGSYYSIKGRCAQWPKSTLQASLSQPVVSGVRTLVSSGRLDPITPPSFGDRAAETLSNKIVVVHEGSGHGATLQSACGTHNLQAFLADPTTTPDTSCAATITNTYMVPPMAVAAPFSVKDIRAELGIEPVPPMIRERLLRRR